MKIKALVTYLLLWGMTSLSFASSSNIDYLNARWTPLHFKPAIERATNQQCLSCHKEILERKPLTKSPAGMGKDQSIAWYQQQENADLVQETFHRRHLVSEKAKSLMKFKCNTCHQGHDPRDEASMTHEMAQTGLILRKSVDPEICLMCHGKFNYQVMAGLADEWEVEREKFKNDCVTCHLESRTKRHKLNFLQEKGIEELGKSDPESCYQCHGGKAWYAISYPYVRRPWLRRMPGIPPAWAADRPEEYDKRFRQ